MKTNKIIELSLQSLLTAVLLGCASTARNKSKVEQAIAEESRALTTAVVETLQLRPADRRDEYTAVALEFAKQDQRLEGFPLDPFELSPLFSGDQKEKLGAQEEVQERFARQHELVEQQRKLERKLVELGAIGEEKQARRTRFLAKWITGGTVLVGGVVAVCIFFPIGIPILGRVLGWVVGKLPNLAGAVGVVGVKAFDAIIRGIEKTRSHPITAAAPAVLTPREGLENEDSRRDGPGSKPNWMEGLEANLSKAMDADHKRLVKSRKRAVA